MWREAKRSAKLKAQSGSFSTHASELPPALCFSHNELLTSIAFFLGVNTLAFTCLCVGKWPTWIPFAYTAQFMVYMPIRAYTYKQKAFHYFLFGESGPCGMWDGGVPLYERRPCVIVERKTR